MSDLISSPQNPRVRLLLTLQQKSAERRRQHLFVVEGRRELSRCLAAGYQPHTIFLCPEIANAEATEPMPQLPPTAPCLIVTPQLYDRIAYRGGTEGIIAIVNESRHNPASTLVREADSSSLIIVLEGVEKPGNIGAILRTADAAGATAVMLCDTPTDLYNPNLIRASTGALFTVPTVCCTTAECISYLKEHGIAILTAQLQDSQPYYHADMRRPVAIVMGTEATGLSQPWRDAADAHIRIPMLGTVDSLNVSVSTAILLYEAVRQRQ